MDELFVWEVKDMLVAVKKIKSECFLRLLQQGKRKKENAFIPVMYLAGIRQH